MVLGIYILHASCDGPVKNSRRILAQIVAIYRKHFKGFVSLHMQLLIAD